MRTSPLLSILAAVLSIGWLVAAPAGAQGIAAKATAKAPASPEIVKLQRQLSALEKRIEELEKPEVDAAEDPDDKSRQEARDKALERRLAALEKSSAGGGSKKAPQPANNGDGEESLTVRVPFVVHDKSGRTVFRIDTREDDRPIVVIGNSLGAAAVIGIDGEGHSSLRLFDAQRHARLLLSAKEEGGKLLLMSKAQKEAVTMSVDQNGAGRLRVFNFAGRAVTALSSDASGGRVLVVDGKSGLNAATLSTSAQGGMVNVYASEGGSPRASMVADDKSGSMNVFNNNGIAAGVIETGQAGSGRLVLANAAGDIVVEAGMLPKGIGIVRTGPGGDGPAGVVGGTVRPASSIQGRK